jgi:hypothetical protein
MRLEGLTFEEAMQAAAAARAKGILGISIYHRFDYDALERDGACYVVYGYTPTELSERRKEDAEPEPPIDNYEITRWEFDADGRQVGEQLFGAETLEELIKLASEQNKAET